MHATLMRSPQPSVDCNPFQAMISEDFYAVGAAVPAPLFWFLFILTKMNDRECRIVPERGRDQRHFTTAHSAIAAAAIQRDVDRVACLPTAARELTDTTPRRVSEDALPVTTPRPACPYCLPLAEFLSPCR